MQAIEILVNCEFPTMGKPQPIALRLVLTRTASQGGSVGVDVRLIIPFDIWGNSSYAFPVGSSVDEMMHFADALQRLHDTHDGVARLEDTVYTDDSWICLQAASGNEGVIMISGSFYDYPLDFEGLPDLVPPEVNAWFGTVTWGWAARFRGLTLQRSALPGIITQLRVLRADLSGNQRWTA
jgi:hypothetical protein